MKWEHPQLIHLLWPVAAFVGLLIVLEFRRGDFESFGVERPAGVSEKTASSPGPPLDGDAGLFHLVGDPG